MVAEACGGRRGAAWLGVVDAGGGPIFLGMLRASRVRVLAGAVPGARNKARVLVRLDGLLASSTTP